MPDNSKKFNPNLHLDIPKWINEKYFENILKSDVNNFNKILNFTIIPATPPGENYTSIMLRIKMDIEMDDGFTEQKSYIMKTMLDNDKGGTFINTLNLFPKEKLMYETILPQLEALYVENGSKVKFAPKCHWIEDKSGRITLVLEDLLTKKFRNINRLKGFDMIHMKRVLEKLAEFHAASVVLQERMGAYPKEFTNTYLPANYQKSKSYQARVQSYKAAMATWGLEDYEKYAKRIPNAEQYVNATLQCFNAETNEFKVLNHGDFWSSNIMLNYTSKDHPKGFTGVVAHKSKLFKREIMAYKEVLPRVEELLASIGDTTKIAPACYYTTESPEPFLILEDMNLNGFENFEKGRLLNLDYVLPTVEKLAKLHACSAVIAAENSKIFEFFQEAPISRNPDRKDFLGFFPVNIRCVAEEISHWKGYEEITEKMFKLAENVLQSAVDMYESHENGFRVFNVADLWIDNLMFHINNETKEPDDVVLFDFQLSYYGSPAMDLNYFLYGSLNENVRKVHMKFIVREYHRILKETLEKLHYEGEIPSLKDITIEIIKNSLQGVIAATCLTPIIFMEQGGFENLENLTSRTEEGDEIRRRNVENPKYKAFLQRTVKEFELSGFLDV